MLWEGTRSRRELVLDRWTITPPSQVPFEVPAPHLDVASDLHAEYLAAPYPTSTIGRGWTTNPHCDRSSKA
jgi:hypothetical protein